MSAKTAINGRRNCLMSVDRKECQRKYYLEHKEKWAKRYIENRKEIKKYQKKYRIEHKEQSKEKHKKYYQEHKEEIKKYRKEHYIENREYQKSYDKQYRKKHKEKRKKQHEQDYNNNKERYKKCSKKWRAENKERLKEYFKKYYREKRKINPKYRLSKSMSISIRRSLKSGKNGGHWEIFVDYNLSDLMKHLEKQFSKGMNWKNYGKWEIDHKIPQKVFNFDKPEHIDFKRCWALDNLQPLWAEENLRKRDKLKLHFQPNLKL